MVLKRVKVLVQRRGTKVSKSFPFEWYERVYPLISQKSISKGKRSFSNPTNNYKERNKKEFIKLIKIKDKEEYPKMILLDKDNHFEKYL
jgi:hypothetical protein